MNCPFRSFTHSSLRHFVFYLCVCLFNNKTIFQLSDVCCRCLGHSVEVWLVVTFWSQVTKLLEHFSFLMYDMAGLPWYPFTEIHQSTGTKCHRTCQSETPGRHFSQHTRKSFLANFSQEPSQVTSSRGWSHPILQNGGSLKVLALQDVLTPKPPSPPTTSFTLVLTTSSTCSPNQETDFLVCSQSGKLTTCSRANLVILPPHPRCH